MTDILQKSVKIKASEPVTDKLLVKLFTYEEDQHILVANCDNKHIKSFYKLVLMKH